MKRVFSWVAAGLLLASGGSAHAFPQSGHPAMLDPSKAKEKAPDTFKAKFETTKGDIVFECTRDWAPNGVDRFYNLVKIGFFDDVAFFRVVKGFVVQWGIHGDPKVSAVWSDANLPPDPPKQSNKRGMLTYAMAGRPDTRSTQLFVNYKDNTSLDAMGFAPICKVAEGMEIADKLFGGYEENVTDKQGEIQAEGNDYLRAKWPELDYVKTAVIVGEPLSADRKAKAEGGESKGGKEDSGDKVVLGVVAAILGGGAAMLFLTRKKDAPAPAPAPAPKSAAKESGAAAPAKKKKKAKREDEGEGKEAHEDDA
jgi:peptidyl-prolyl cis-trans isomerase A (cyclophilin A)